MAASVTTPAAKNIKLFQLTQKYYHDVYIFPFKMQPNRRFNWKNVLILCVCVEQFISMLLFFIFEATSMEEFAITFFGFVGLLSSICYYLINIFQRNDLFRIIEHFEKFIEKC